MQAVRNRVRLRTACEFPVLRTLNPRGRTMADQPQIKSADEVQSDKRRGGDVRTLLSPKTVGSTSGFMGVATLDPGDWIAEHYHPYSEEFIYVVEGEITARLD